MAIELEFLRDAAEFLAAAGPHLARNPVQNTVVATMAQRIGSGAAPADERDWWLVVRDGRDVVSAGMRTAPFPPRPPFLLPMPDEAARLLARRLVERDEPLVGINGALPSVRVCAEEMVRFTGGSVTVAVHTRLFEVTEVTPPPRPRGALRAATADDLELAIEWYDAFATAADEQAGRPAGLGTYEMTDPEVMRKRIEGGWIWFWIDENSERVHLTAVNPVSFGAARIGPVYTPPKHRGIGYASAAVAEVSQRVLDAGARPCLFTDQANPTSNRIYSAIGYRPVTDMANLVITESAAR
jgi:GNAT superfamily N-acetyltransferase